MADTQYNTSRSDIAWGPIVTILIVILAFVGLIIWFYRSPIPAPSDNVNITIPAPAPSY